MYFNKMSITQSMETWAKTVTVLYNCLIRVDFQFNDIFNERTNERYLTNCVLGSSKYKWTFDLAVQTINGPAFQNLKQKFQPDSPPTQFIPYLV